MTEQLKPCPWQIEHHWVDVNIGDGRVKCMELDCPASFQRVARLAWNTRAEPDREGFKEYLEKCGKAAIEGQQALKLLQAYRTRVNDWSTEGMGNAEMILFWLDDKAKALLEEKP